MIRTSVLLGLLALAAGAQEQEAPNLARVTPPAAKVTVHDAIVKGVEFLVTHQNADGSFGHHTIGRNYELWCDVPGGHMAFKAASTALCWLGLNDAPVQTDASKKAQERCLAWLVKHAAVKRAYAEQFYNIWPYGYGLRALAQALNKKAPGAEPEAIRATMRKIYKGLAGLQTHDGGWSYLDFNAPLRRPIASNSFTTATVLVAVDEAQRAGVEAPKGMVEKAVRYLWRNRTPDGNYYYSFGWRYHPTGRINRPQGSSMRNQACNVALRMFDGEKMTIDDMRVGLQQLVDNHRFAIAGMRRPRPHESWYAVSGYFYLYGEQYAALVLERMPEPDQRIYWPYVVRFTLKARQPDGSFWDYPTYDYHKYYGTGYALMTLSRCPEEIAKGIEP